MRTKLSHRRWLVFAIFLLAGLQGANAWYSPNQQRWINRDPIGEAGDLNLYRSFANRPVNVVDTDGRKSVPNENAPPSTITIPIKWDPPQPIFQLPYPTFSIDNGQPIQTTYFDPVFEPHPGAPLVLGAVTLLTPGPDEVLLAGMVGSLAKSTRCARSLPSGPGAMNRSEVFRRLGDLEPIHRPGMNPLTEANLRRLSDDDLMRTVTNPFDGQMVKVKEGSNRLLDGNTRVYEMRRRNFDPSTRIPVDELPK